MGGLSHEFDAAEQNDLGVRLRGRSRQLQGIAGKIGGVLDLGTLIIMRYDQRVPGLGQFAQLRLKWTVINYG